MYPPFRRTLPFVLSQRFDPWFPIERSEIERMAAWRNRLTVFTWLAAYPAGLLVSDVKAYYYLAKLDTADTGAQSAAIDSLVDLGAPGVGILVEGLSSANERTREAAMQALMKIGVPAAEELAGCLRGPASAPPRHPNCARSAILALGEMRAEKAAAPLLEQIAASPVIEETQLAKASLVKIGAGGFPALRKGFIDERTPVKMASLEVLKEVIGTAGFMTLLDDEDTSVGTAAAAALTTMGAPGIKTLVDSVGHSGLRGRQAAAGALLDLSKPPVEDLLASVANANSDAKANLIPLLLQIRSRISWGESNEATAQKVLGEEIRRAASLNDQVVIVDALMAMSNVALLAQVLKEPGTPVSLRESIVRALADMRDARALDALAAVAADPKATRTMKSSAFGGLGAMGGPKATSILSANANDPAARAALVQARNKAGPPPGPGSPTVSAAVTPVAKPQAASPKPTKSRQADPLDMGLR